MNKEAKWSYVVAPVVVMLSLIGVALAMAAPSAAQINPFDLGFSNLRFSATEVAPGTPVTITALVTNSGSVDGTAELALKVNGALVQTKSVFVPALSGVDVSFVFTPPVDGTYAIELGESSGAVTPLTGIVKAVTPPQPATCTLSELSVSPAEVAPGGNVTVSVSLTNNGEVSGTCTVILLIDGVEVDRKDVNISELSVESVTFDVAAPPQLGEYTVGIGDLSAVLKG